MADPEKKAADLTDEELTQAVEKAQEEVTMLDRLAEQKHTEAKTLAFRRDKKRDRIRDYLAEVTRRKSPSQAPQH